MLEQKLEENTAAVNRLADALEKQAAGGGAADKPTTAAKAKAGSKPKNTAEQVKAAIMDVKEKVGADEAKAIIEKFAGKGKKLADLANMPEKFDAAVAAAQAALPSEDEEATEEDDDI